MEIEERCRKLELEYETQLRAEYGVVNRTGGRTRKTPYREPTFFNAESEAELAEKLAVFARGIGARRRGNTRTGRSLGFYAGLIELFFIYRKQGIKLPRRNISKKHANDRLVELLKDCDYLPPGITPEQFRDSVELRKVTHHKIERILVRIADAVEKPPQQSSN